LPAGGHTASWRKDVVVTIAFIEFGTLDGRIELVPVVDQLAFIQHFGTFFIKTLNYDNALDAGTAARIGMYEICVAIIVP
jgi:hypothetical protein